MSPGRAPRGKQASPLTHQGATHRGPGDAHADHRSIFQPFAHSVPPRGRLPPPSAPSPGLPLPRLQSESLSLLQAGPHSAHTTTRELCSRHSPHCIKQLFVELCAQRLSVLACCHTVPQCLPHMRMPRKLLLKGCTVCKPRGLKAAQPRSRQEVLSTAGGTPMLRSQAHPRHLSVSAPGDLQKGALKEGPPKCFLELDHETPARARDSSCTHSAAEARPRPEPR